eukprot:TRINITY_DN1739_c0_g1_i1.p1 TRINITY_DN1739_c0_g1~~TRINITY_DN1739_c0_g1_i1.p1  ORF type:complete len:434 (+),score=62.05 TRINITY_DN1739_c0_g1_i1:156-1457(+)
MDQHSWYKTNIKSFRIRLLKRQVVQVQKKVDAEEQKSKIEDEIIKRFPIKRIVWQYKVFPEDLNYKQMDDSLLRFVSHDAKQSEIIETEYQNALTLQNTKQVKEFSHSFVLSGEWEKNHCKWQYEIMFGNILNPGTWKKINTITKKDRELARIVIWDEEEQRLGKFVMKFETLQAKSKGNSDQAKSAVLERCQKLKINFAKIEEYISKHSKIIIHLHLNQYLEKYLKDTQYRSQFETGLSSGSKDLQNRKFWEQRMFEDYYEKALGSERPKYGALNFFNDPKGDQTCRVYGYGNDFLELKNDIRQRCTFTNKDSSYDDSIVGTFQDFCHVLMGFTDEELIICSKIAEGTKVTQPEEKLINYKEVQIHGPIEFAKDVVNLHVSNQHFNNNKLLEMVKQFQKQFNIGVVYIDGEPDQMKIEKLSKIEKDINYGNH